MMTPQQVLAAEMRAVADALRQIRTALVNEAHTTGRPAMNDPDLRNVMALGPLVSDALEALAALLARTPPAP
jgi:hypothetical protein